MSALIKCRVEAAAVAVSEEDVLEHLELPLVLQELPRLLDLVLFRTQLVLLLREVAVSSSCVHCQSEASSRFSA